MVKLGWPVEGVGDFLDGLVQDIVDAVGPTIDDLLAPIKSALAGLADAVWNALPEWIKSGLTFLGELAGKAWESLWTFISDPVGSLAGLADAVWDLVEPTLAGIGDTLAGVGEAVYDALPQPLKDFVNWIGELGRALWDGLSSFVEDPVGSIQSGLDALSLTVTTAFNGAMATVGGWVSDALAGVAKALGDALSGFMSWLTEKLQWLAEAVTGAATAVRDAVVGFFETIAGGFVATITEIFSPGSPDKEIQKEAEKAFQAMFTELEQLTKIERESQPPYEALLTAIVSTAARFLVLKIGVEAAGAAVDAAHPIKGLKAHAIAAGLMGILDMPAVIGPILSEPIRQGIFIPWQHYWASRYTPQIPSYGDMIRIYVREGYLEEYQREIPAGMMEDFRLLGYNAYWTKALWGAHWVLPSTGQVFEMLHRGIITEDVMSTYLKTADILSVWRSRLIAISWDLPGRIDARWMAGWDLIDVEEYGDLLVKRGLDPEWRDRVAEATVKQQMAPEINKLRDNIKNDMIKGYILEADARAALSELGFSPARIEYHIQDALEDRERRRKDLLVDNYLDAYIKELIATEDELAAYLADVIVDLDLVKLIVDDAYIRRYKKPKAD